MGPFGMIRYKVYWNLLLIYCLMSCNQKSTISHEIQGEWTVEEIEAGSVHGVTQFSKSKVDIIPNAYISLKSTLTLKPDNSFIFDNDGGQRLDGYFQFKDDTLILKSKQFAWLTGKLERIDDTKIVLTVDEARFFNIQNDTILFYSGDEDKITLINKNGA
jgi:hypothetical protein